MSYGNSFFQISIMFPTTKRKEKTLYRSNLFLKKNIVSLT